MGITQDSEMKVKKKQKTTKAVQLAKSKDTTEDDAAGKCFTRECVPWSCYGAWIAVTFALMCAGALTVKAKKIRGKKRKKADAVRGPASKLNTVHSMA